MSPYLMKKFLPVWILFTYLIFHWCIQFLLRHPPPLGRFSLCCLIIASPTYSVMEPIMGIILKAGTTEFILSWEEVQFHFKEANSYIQTTMQKFQVWSQLIPLLLMKLSKIFKCFHIKTWFTTRSTIMVTVCISLSLYWWLK